MARLWGKSDTSREVLDKASEPRPSSPPELEPLPAGGAASGGLAWLGFPSMIAWLDLVGWLFGLTWLGLVWFGPVGFV